jgi:SAM-dependent methyltransferase
MNRSSHPVLPNPYQSGRYLDTNPDWHASDAPWKAQQVLKMLRRHHLEPGQVLELGCGTGVMLHHLAASSELAHSCFQGFDVSPQAIALAQRQMAENASLSKQRVQILLGDPLADSGLTPDADLLLVMDVIEHVPDYLGFLQGCRGLAPMMMIHIPLDLHVSSLIRNAFVPTRYSIGHLHYFTYESALATLRDCGFEVIEAAYTNAGAELFRHHPSLRRALANAPRFLISCVSRHWAARLLGGYSLLVLCRSPQFTLQHDGP